jgi:hypothetical protein
MRLADFNADGKDDLLVTNGSLSNVALLFGDGTGKLRRGNQCALRTHAPRRLPRVTSIMMQDRLHHGQFRLQHRFRCLGKKKWQVSGYWGWPSDRDRLPNQIISADFNGGRVAGFGIGRYRIKQDRSSGGDFAWYEQGRVRAGKGVPTGTQPEGLTATDFNHDGHLDLVVTNFGTLATDHGGVSLLLGNGDGSFQAPGNFAAGDFPVGIASGDFNGDGNPDVVVADFGTSAGVAGVTLLLGNGNNGFAPAQTVVSFPQFTVFTNILSGDFNNDGKQDIAYISELNDNRVSVQFGNGDGTFQAAIPALIRSAFTTIFFDFEVGDFNNDGIPDFAVEEDGLTEIVLNDGNGHFTSSGVFSEGNGATFTFVPKLVLADFNGDGALDVAAPDGFGQTMAVLLGNGDGRWERPQSSVVA